MLLVRGKEKRRRNEERHKHHDGAIQPKPARSYAVNTQPKKAVNDKRQSCLAKSKKIIACTAVGGRGHGGTGVRRAAAKRSAPRNSSRKENESQATVVNCNRRHQLCESSGGKRATHNATQGECEAAQ
jgi:hypothetical protein